MSFVRFTPREYRAIAEACRGLDLRRLRPADLRRQLAAAVEEALPALAERIARMGTHKLLLIAAHFRPRRHEPALTPAELKALTEAFGPLLHEVRFARPLRRVMAQEVAPEAPNLAAKLYDLSPEEFQRLCERVRRGGR